MKTVIFITHHPFIQKFEDDFYFSELIKAGYHFEYWDMSPVYFHNISLTDSSRPSYVLSIDSLKQLEDKIKAYNSPKTLFVSQLTYQWKGFKIFRLLTKYSCTTAYFARGALPAAQSNSTSSYLRHHNLWQIWKKIVVFMKYRILYLLRKTGYIRHYDYVFNSGVYGMRTIGIGNNIDKQFSKIIQINSFDYDKYFDSTENYHRLTEGRYCVFLDEYLPFHPDWDMLGFKKIDPVHYYKIMNIFFDRIEEKYGVKVVIAAHPKGDYADNNPYGGRELYKYSTNELTKFAEFTMAHMSSSINFAVMYSKKVLLLITDDYKKTYSNTCYLMSQYFANELGSELINCDEPFPEHIAISDVDLAKYEKYKSNFLTSHESENKASRDILIDFLKTI